MNTSPIITLHMVASLDGIIAKPDNSVAWFETSHPYEAGVEFPSPEEYASFVDCYVMGANTYEHACELATNYGWPYGEIPTYVVTHRNLSLIRPNIRLFAGALNELAIQLRNRYKKIWVVGGPKLITAFLQQRLADEIRLPILPILLGGGRPFFEQLAMEQPLVLLGSTAYKNGMVELHYRVGRQ